MQVGDLFVTFLLDMVSLPYLVQRINPWGVSDGTMYEKNPCTDETKFILLYTCGYVRVYRPLEGATCK